MSAKLRIEHDYAADVETVFALISDPDYIERKYADLGCKDISVDRSETDEGGCDVVTKRTMTFELPGFASKVLTPTQSPIQSESWAPANAAGERVCTYSVQAPGTPSRIDGKHKLSPTATGSHHTIDIEVKVSIPLIGGKIEKFAADQGKADIDAQFAHTDAELAKPSG